MRAHEFVTEKWTKKYKKSINCSSPKGFSQKAHCAGRKKNEDVVEGIDSDDTAKTAYIYGLRHGREGVGDNMSRAQAEWGDDFKHYNAGFLKGRNQKAKSLKAAGQGNSKRQQGVAEDLDENLRKWFKDKWVRFGPDGKIRGDCARGSEKEGKPKCLPRSKAQSLGKKGRATAAARKRREDPNANRSGKAINVKTK